MNNIFNYFTGLSDWVVPFVPLLCVVVYFAVESRWEAYTRRKNYEELKILHDLREKSIITQEEFEEKKEILLGV